MVVVCDLYGEGCMLEWFGFVVLLKDVLCVLFDVGYLV